MPEGPVKRAITFLTRRGCTLCHDSLPGIEEWASRLGLGVEVIDVDSSPDLSERYGDRVPVVISSEGEVLLWGRWGRLREARMMLRARYG